MNSKLPLFPLTVLLTLSLPVFAQDTPSSTEDAPASDEPLPLVKNLN